MAHGIGVRGKRWIGWAIVIPAMTIPVLAACAVVSIPSPTPPAPENMVFVPAGTFLMGSEEGREDEAPMRKVNLEAFYIDRYEVTNAQYVEFLNDLGSHVGRCEGHDCIEIKDEDPDSHITYNYETGRYEVEAGYEDHPVIKVSWYGAKAFCEHYGKRLPTEAEWEKAARGADGRVYPWGDEADASRANVDDRIGDTTPVGSYPAGASPFGALDMAGNVWEWVGDWYRAYPGGEYRSEFFGFKYKVVRGGSWNHPLRDARCSSRDIAHPARRILVVGFRCAWQPAKQ